MPRGTPLQLVALGLLLVLLAAPVSAVGVGLHLASEQDHHAELVASLATLATHGHDHDASTAEHDHPTLRSGGPEVPLPAVGCAEVSPSLAAPVRGLAIRGVAEAPPPTESPPLFRQHCALLL